MENAKRVIATHDGRTTVSWRRLATCLLAVFTLFTLVTAAPLSTAATPIVSATSGIREVITSGSITTGSNQLAVASAAGFNIGDWVIVEIGNEPGRGQRGTRGVGGTWPSMSAPTEAAVRASNPGEGGHMWAEDTGYVLFPWDGQWYYQDKDREPHWYVGNYYLGKAVPRSLQARVTSINGNTLTLDRSAAATASGATVYFDNAPLITDMLAQQGSVTIPAGNFPIGGVVWIRDRSGVTLSGQGKDATRLYTPKGVTGAIEARNAPNTIIQNLTLHGNWGDEGFGLNWDTSTPAGELSPVDDYIFGALLYPNGIMLDRGTDNSEVRDVRVINVAQNAVGSSFTSNTWARRVENIQTNVPRVYVQWQFKWGDTNGGGTEDTVIRSTYLIPGWSSFKSYGVSHIRAKATNSVMSANGSGAFFYDSPELYITANAFHPESDPIAASVAEPLININTNIGILPWVSEGGIIRNAKMIQEGKVNGFDNLSGIVVNSNNPNIRIEGGYFQAPDYTRGGTSQGTQAINSTVTNNPPLIDGFVAVGRSSDAGAEQYNVYNLFGDIRSCVAWNPYPSRSCQTPAEAGITPITVSMTPAMIPTYPGTVGGGTTPPGNAPNPPATASPNGTRGTQVVDSSGGVWTFSGTKTLRNGVWMGDGNASEYLYVNSIVYAIASDGTLWKWNNGWSFAGTDIAALTGGSSGTGSSGSGSSGSGSSGSGSGSSGSDSSGSGSSGSGSSGSGSSGSGSGTPTPSANGTRGNQVVDSTGAVWTFNGTQTMRNGVWMNEGNASEYLFVNNTVYAITSDGGLWKWNNGWSYAGTDIGALSGSSGSGSSSGTATTSPNGTRGKQVVDAAGAVWTFDGTKTLRNGVWMSEGNASEYLYVNSTVYAIGSDGSLWKWNNGWSFAGTDIAALTGGSSSNGGTGTSTEPRKPSVKMDFSGNGTSSVLWRNDSAGQNVIWSIEKGAVANQAFITGADSNWDIVGSGDFNADGKADILWRDDEGNVAIWLMNDISVAGGGVIANAPTSWKVEGVGDLNGDGKADILWRASDGSVSVWLMDNVAIAARATLVNVPNTWTVSGIGDLNKDGNADIVWRNSDGSVVIWLMNGANITEMISTGKRSTAWSIVGVADFNGDGKADLLWRNTTNGQNGVWYMDGGKQSGSMTIPVLADTKWKVVGTGDYNGDGKADIMWRHSQTGDNTIWVMNGAAASKKAIPTVNDANWVVVKP